ncbi:ABC transporter substrate-binding protein [Brevibacterium jeotgali]|uniref:Polar amino acid transport system substrate-binding protein n=1 Tax=Brevibacterium jeotgali TaxID=1262550 RepID=A0A2H1L5M6_9MICO|nr:ABC transporter substrate-binding protein [Brevibacterium jeotgali]TWB98989.1 polar amino acid transport system substrate-binding protein [Brevibacterium jeotgali]SMY12179.1 polar amino acid transport system substrate-binding protein [Brevibacterium jeotgali]
MTSRSAVGRSSFAAAALLPLLAVSACGGADDSGSDDGMGLVESGVLTVCTTMPAPPFEFEEDGEAKGLEIDLAQALADRLDVEPEYINSPFESIQSAAALDTGQCDIALAAMTVTEERESKMQFSDSIVYDNLALMAEEDAGYSSIDDLGASKVGVQDATTSSEFAADKGLNTVQFEASSLLQQSLQAGQIEAGIANISLVLAVMQADDDIELVESFDTNEHLAAAVQMVGTPVLDEFNALLAGMREDGSYDELVEEWFADAADAAKVAAEDASRG